MGICNRLFSLLVVLPHLVLGGNIVGGECSTDNDRLDTSTGKSLSDCDESTFCSGAANGTCQPRKCRRDVFPFGFDRVSTIPPLCKYGTYCPDEGSGCKPLVAVGQPCQMDRDEQCTPPPPTTPDEPESRGGQVKPLCLRSVCTYANMTIGQPCILDVVTYTDGPYTNTITRHNCQTPTYYCHGDYRVCIRTKEMGLPCAIDQECQSFNCGTKGVCVAPAGTPARLKAGPLALTGISVIAAMTAVVIMLSLFHKRQRLKRYREIREYYDEQTELRKSLAALHAAAADHYEKATVYDSERMPIY